MSRDERPQVFHSVRRIVICTIGGVPHSHRGASTVLFFQYIRGILEAGWGVLHLVVLNNLPSGESSIGDYRSEISRFGEIRVLGCSLERPYRISRWTKRVRPLSLPDEMKLRLREFDPDLFLCFDIASAGLMKEVAPPRTRIVWLGDLNFQTAWYHNLYDAKERSAAWLRLPLTWLACSRWRRFYKEVLDGAGCVIAASSSASSEVAKLHVISEYLPYPWPVTTRSMSAAPVPSSEIPSFLFFGTLGALGSRSALRFLFDKLYPALVKLWGRAGFRIYICGNLELPAWAAEALLSRPELVFKGFVDDLEDLGRRCHAMIAPIDVPVGNRSRIVTAMAYGWPIVAHVNTARGNPELVSGSNCLLADGVDQFVKHMQFTVDQPAAVSALGRAARVTYSKSFEPAVAVEKLIERLDKALTLRSGVN